MHHRFHPGYLTILLFGLTAPSQPRRFELVPSASRVWFRASATLGDFEGQTRKVTGWAEFSESDYSDARAATSADSAFGHNLYGRLTVRGSSHPVVFTARIQARGDSLHLSGKAPVQFTRLGMKPPSRMLGTTKVKDAFTLHFEVIFAAPASAPDPAQ